MNFNADGLRKPRPSKEERLQAWLQAWPWAKTVAMGVEVKVRQFKLWADVWTQGEAEVKAETQAKVRAQKAKAKAKAGEHAEARLLATLPWVVEEQTEERKAKEKRAWAWVHKADAEAEAEARAVTEVEAEAEARIEALALAGAWGWARAEARKRGESVPAAAVDSSTIRDILSNLHHNGIAHQLWDHSPEGRDEYSCIIDVIAPITRLPFELLRQIFLIIIDETSSPPMLVCKHWHSILTSTWASLKLGTRTPMDVVARKLERNQWLLDVVVDTDSDRDDFTPSDSAFEAIFAAIEASSRWRSFVVESFPRQADLPEDLVNHRLQRCPNTTMSRFTTFKVKSTCETSPFLNGLLHILGTTAGPELTTVEINSPSVISFLAPAYPFIFRSIRVLSLDTPGVPSSVDLLPHLHQLETFTVSHISFPIYHIDVNLPFIHTLRHLKLRAVSIQWMSGRTFPTLEYCTLIFPLHRNTLHTFSTTLPNCKHLTFQGSPLDILNGISAHKLTQLSVTCSGSFNRRGSRQLVQLSHQVLGGSRLAPTILHISVGAKNQAWINALPFMSNLEELIIDNARPTSLGAKVFRSLVIRPTRRGACAPLCPSLKRLGLKYHRWLRRTERFSLIPDLVYLIKSRERSNYALESLSMCMTSNQEDPLQLVEGSRMSPKGLQRLAEESGITGEEFVELMATELVQVVLKSVIGLSKMDI